MNEKAKKIKEKLDMAKEINTNLDFKVDPKLVENFQKQFVQTFPYVELKPIDENSEKIKQDRMEYGYDSICLRVDQLITELAELKARDPLTKDYRDDIDHWKHWYGMRAVRIYDILDDLLDKRGHSCADRKRDNKNL